MKIENEKGDHQNEEEELNRLKALFDLYFEMKDKSYSSGLTKSFVQELDMYLGNNQEEEDN